MDSNQVLNILVPILSVIAAPVFLLPYLLFKLVNYIFRSIFIENVAKKVVLITGASSGIGEHLAYEYARRGAYLVLVARRGDKLRVVADKARQLGSPDVIFECADVSNLDDCKRFVDSAVDHFGTLDHLVNNAGISRVCMFEDSINFDSFAPIMNINFWGSVYCTHFALPHLRKSKGKIAVIGSSSAWFPIPRLTIYGASKGALISFYKALRIELGSDVGITIVTPGLIDSEMTRENKPKAKGDFLPSVSTEKCARVIFNSICRGDRYFIEPAWCRTAYFLGQVCPEVLERIKRWLLITWPMSSDPELQRSSKTQ